jgi:prepilin-type N-terminal cleavage/methylation domain-containing protein
MLVEGLKMKNRGYTLIEVMIVIIMIGIVGITVASITTGVAVGSAVSWGINGVTEMRCIEGYKFIVGQEGQARQVMDEFGKGVRCEVHNFKIQ